MVVRPYARGRDARERELKYHGDIVVRLYTHGRWQFDELFDHELVISLSVAIGRSNNRIIGEQAALDLNAHSAG